MLVLQIVETEIATSLVSIIWYPWLQKYSLHPKL